MNDVTKIREDLSYFFSKLNIAASPLDARAIQIMNDFFGIPSLIDENIMLKRQNELYRSLQDSDSFVFLEGMPDRPWTNEEVEIVNRHNNRTQSVFAITKLTEKDLDAMGFPELHKLQDARKNLILAIRDFSSQYEDEGTKFNEVMQIWIMQKFTDEFKKYTNASASADVRH